MLLNRRTEATQMLMPLHDRDELYSLCSWLSYPYFDISSFPKLQVILEREKAKRGKPVEIPFALKPEIEK